MAKALWHDVVLAESDHTEVVEGNHYFPLAALNQEYFEESDTQTTCPWKGIADYFDVVINGQRNRDAAWIYKTPKTEAHHIANYVAFWRGVTVEA